MILEDYKGVCQSCQGWNYHCGEVVRKAWSIDVLVHGELKVYFYAWIAKVYTCFADEFCLHACTWLINILAQLRC